jgi:hypothetical protein
MAKRTYFNSAANYATQQRRNRLRQRRIRRIARKAQLNSLSNELTRQAELDSLSLRLSLIRKD